MAHDRNFDDLTDQFSQNIYGTTKGRIREIIVWQDIKKILSQFPAGKPLVILDAGGGQGQFACRLAQLGHQVTICDLSSQMLDIARANAESQQLTLHYYHCSIQNLQQYTSAKFDLVMCHAVLEWVEEPMALLNHLKGYLAHYGILSLMFFNYHGLLFRTATLGNFGYINSGLNKRKKKTLSPDYPRKPADVYQWLDKLAFEIIEKTGIRVFHDYLVDKQKRESRFDELLALELQYCQQEPYISFARYIHVTAKLKYR